jgi:hypothetical protein
MGWGGSAAAGADEAAAGDTDNVFSASDFDLDKHAIGMTGQGEAPGVVWGLESVSCHDVCPPLIKGFGGVAPSAQFRIECLRRRTEYCCLSRFFLLDCAEGAIGTVWRIEV